MEGHVTFPAEEGEARRAAIEAVAALDDCRATVVVMLVGRDQAQLLFERVYAGGAWTGDRRFVVVGTEAVGRASNAPEGLFAVRTIAQSENKIAQQVRARFQRQK